MGTLVFILVLSVLVIVHEYGHFLTAKKLGVRVERFAIGFGPKLLTRQIAGGTEFSLCLIPLGGYVKMAGDERSGCQGKEDEFYSKSVGHRALIVFAGPLVNYIFAYFCFWLIFLVGYPAMGSRIGELMDGYPAQKAGIKAEDTILRIDDHSIESWDDIQSLISRTQKQKLNFVILRNDQELSFDVSLVEEETKNVFGQTVRSRFIGIRPDGEIIFLRYGPIASMIKAGEKIGMITFTTYKAVYLMATGGMPAKDAVTGPIGIFYLVRDAASLGFSYVLYLMSVISVSLAIFNLFPLPILDGGHLVFFAIEKIRGNPIPEKINEIINQIGLIAIIFLAIFVFYNDFVRYGLLNKILEFASRLLS